MSSVGLYSSWKPRSRSSEQSLSIGDDGRERSIFWMVSLSNDICSGPLGVWGVCGVSGSGGEGHSGDSEDEVCGDFGVVSVVSTLKEDLGCFTAVSSGAGGGGEDLIIGRGVSSSPATKEVITWLCGARALSLLKLLSRLRIPLGLSRHGFITVGVQGVDASVMFTLTISLI